MYIEANSDDKTDNEPVISKTAFSPNPLETAKTPSIDIGDQDQAALIADTDFRQKAFHNYSQYPYENLLNCKKLDLFPIQSLKVHLSYFSPLSRNLSRHKYRSGNRLSYIVLFFLPITVQIGFFMLKLRRIL